jgi:hypothetical protein
MQKGGSYQINDGRPEGAGTAHDVRRGSRQRRARQGDEVRKTPEVVVAWWATTGGGSATRGGVGGEVFSGHG